MDVRSRGRRFGTEDGERADRRLSAPALGLIALHALAVATVGVRDPEFPSETVCAVHGIAALERFDQRLAPGLPPAACSLLALPEAAAPGDGLDYSGAAWRGRDLQPGTTMSTAADPLAIAETRGPTGLRLWHRTVAALVAFGFAWTVWSWSRRLWDARAAILSTGLYALAGGPIHLGGRAEPWPLATLAAFAAFAALWRFMELGDTPRALAFLSLAFASTALHPAGWVLLPALLTALVVWVSARSVEAWRRAGRGSRAILLSVCAVIAMWAGTWAGHGFRRSISTDATYQPDWSVAVPTTPSGLLARNKLLESGLLPQGTVWAVSRALRSVPEAPAGSAAAGEVRPRAGLSAILHPYGPLAHAVAWLAAAWALFVASRRHGGVRAGAGSGVAISAGFVVWVAVTASFARDTVWIWSPLLPAVAVAAGGLLRRTGEDEPQRHLGWAVALPVAGIVVWGLWAWLLRAG